MVTDDAGNSVSCSQLVIVKDSVNPIIVCPSTVITGTNNGCTASGVSLGTPYTSDNCSITSIVNNAPNAIPLGNTTVVWTITDGSGNFATCTQLVIIKDTIKPTITCPPAKIASTNSGCSATAVILGMPVTSDNCNIASITNNAPAAFPLGNSTVTWTITDGSGNISTCNQLVTVNDTIKPSINCPSAKIVSTNTGCTATGVSFGTPITSDNCHVFSVTNNAPGTFPIGNTTFLWTVTDDAGNMATCSQLITVIDSVKPTIICPASVIRGTNSGCTAIGVALGSPNASDNCHVTSITNNAPSTFQLGNTFVSWTITDSSGNIATCTQLVTIKDTISPTIICPATKIVSTNSGCTAIGVALGIPLTSDNCHVTVVSNNAPIEFQVGTTTVIWTVTDSSGNVATCSQLVTVIDSIKPSITCPPNVIAITNTGCTAVGVTLGYPTSSDNCHVETITNNAPGVFPLGNTIVTWIASDEQGNSSLCTQLVTVLDTIKPTIYCPSSVVVGTNTGCTATGVSLGTPFVMDNCTITSIINNAPAAFPLGNNSVTWTVTDGSGNTAICSQLVTVNDNVNPTITCPSNIIKAINTGCNATNVVLGIPTTHDNCSIASVTNNAPTVFSLGITTVTWTITDGSGNIATCIQLVTIIDSIKPTITCPPTVLKVTNVGCIATGVVLGTPTTSDNCHVASVTNNAPSTFPLGTTIITWTVTDDAGNSSSCTQLVIVNDNVNPIIICPATVITGTNSGCTATGVLLGTPFTSDNCSVASVTNNAPSLFPLGNNTVRWTVTDGSGNTTTCSQLVTVNDNIAPIINCPPAKIVVTNSACTATGVSLGLPVTSDNCSIASVINNAPSAFPYGNTIVTWTITDGSGNIASCNQLITVIDSISPIISCPPTIFSGTNSGCTATGIDLGTPTTSDNCHVVSVINNAPAVFPLGNTTVTWTVTDEAGNTAFCYQLVKIIDTINPIIICPPAIINGTNSGCAATGITLGTPTTSDNCSIASISNNAPLVFPLGVTSVKWTIVDISGNSDTCTQLVTVHDNVNPTINCPANIIALPNNGCTATNITLGNPIANDNCSIANISNNAPLTYAIGNTTVTWTVTDSSGNSATCNQIVTIVDSIYPIINCPPGVSVNTLPGNCTVSGISLGTPNASDNCQVASLVNNAPVDFSVGTTNVIWIATDGAGNSSNCIQVVTVGSAPLAMDDYVSTPENTPILINELLNDVDCGNNLNPGSVTIVTGTGPSHGTAIINSITGIITYTPTSLFIGQDQFDYQVCDSTNLCSIATVYINVSYVNKQILGVAKALSKIEVQEDASFNLSFIITVQNLGNEVIHNLQVTDSLSETFPTPLSFTIISPPFSNSTLTTNDLYNGSTDIKLLDSTLSFLNIGALATIEFSINVITTGIEQTYFNSAIGSGYISTSNRITDISENGYVTDPNGNGYAGDVNEDDPTPIPLYPDYIFIPNGFSPDGDGINDLFVIRGIENYPECKLTIYNRWGNMVYTKNGYKNDWDGKPMNSELKIGESIVPRGTYYYIFDFNKDNRKPKCGYFIIQY